MYKKIFTLLWLVLLAANINVFAQIDPGTENLTHSWTFDDGTAIDTVGNAEGTLMGNAEIQNGSLLTTSADSWLELPAAEIGINSYPEITIEAWFKSVPGGNPSFYMLASFGNTMNSIGVNYYFMTPAREDDVSRAGISCGDESTPWASETFANGPEYDDGKLHHMVSTLDDENITLYIDGELQESTPLDSNNTISAISTAYAYLAKSVYDGDATWRGEILEFNIYDKALSSDEILYLHNESNVNASQRPVIVEAESGEVGSDFSIVQEDSIEYVTIQTSSEEYNPGNDTRVITYEVAFPDTGSYALFARMRVGEGADNDDSFLFGNGFGDKVVTADSEWVLVNGLHAAGFSEPDDIVEGVGSLGSEIWKWVNISHFVDSTFFIVGEDSLTRTFQIGGREDGLDIDKFAFGKSNLYYTVGNLDNGEPGFTKIPESDTTDAWEGPPLASNQPKFVGNIYSPAQIENFESYWNFVIPENAGKWGSVEGTRDEMNWGGLDAAYNLAKDNGFPFNFHVLLWGAQQPGWINDLTSEEQLAEITEWFEAVAERYPDIDYLQVVNEPLVGHNPPDGNNGRANYKEALGGDGETGYDWVITAFRMAREIFPEDTKLMINDYNIINNNESTSTYRNIINNLKAEGLIDAIGVQGHAFTTTAPVATLRSNLSSLGSTGLPIQVTELDIDGPTDDIQLQDYQRIFPALYEHPDVEGITLWGWRPGLWREDAYLINQDGTERPALVWLRNYLDSVSVNPVSVEDIEDMPYEYSLSNNYPNPFNPTTTIEYSIAKTSKVTLKIYDILGEEVKTLVEETKSPGKYSINFDASELASGVYFYQINAGNFITTKKLMLIK